MTEEQRQEHREILTLTGEIVASYVSNNSVPVGNVPELMQAVYDQLSGLGAPKEEPMPELIPAVPIKKSVTDGYLVCLEDGQQLKMLKRHLKTAYDMTPEDYRAKWGLPGDYPMVAPAYARTRQALAKKIGLGRKKEAAPKGRGRKNAAMGSSLRRDRAARPLGGFL
ncbi:MAG: MucR family transcriptional regulator, partial [Pseudomonadota bacterium]